MRSNRVTERNMDTAKHATGRRIKRALAESAKTTDSVKRAPVKEAHLDMKHFGTPRTLITMYRMCSQGAAEIGSWQTPL